MRTLTILMILAAAACGGSEGKGIDATGDGGMVGPDADPSSFATLMGTVWVPGNGLGMVPAGEEIPVFDAVVYLSSQRPDAFVEGASCRPCTEAPANAVQTDHDGNFIIANINPGTYWMTIEKGDFRLEQEVTLAPQVSLELGADQTTLPSVDDPANGKTIPKIALATGIFDDMEDILGKMGMGAVDASGAFDGPSAAGVFEFYDNGGPNAAQAVGTLAELVGSLDRMMKYDIIFIPCSGSNHVGALQDQQVLKNIRDYVAMGGKLYVTDWSGEWMDNVFPEQITLEGDTEDTPAAAYNATANTWNTDLFGDANGSLYTSNNAEVTDDDLFSWLNGQMGPSAEEPDTIITFDASHFDVVDNWNTIVATTPTQVGLDEEGLPLIDSPKAYVIGGHGSETPKLPLTVTFEPAGCGRVLYSTYHTTDNAHAGLVPQERILLYLIMEIGVCVETPILI